MNLFYLRYFVKLAHVQHYTKAAEQLCITQPSLSHAIAQLEKELGVPLFEKTGRNTALTRFGEEFLSCAERTLSTLDEGIASLQRSARGEGLIRLGFLRPLGTEFIPCLAARFLSGHPDLDIQFTFHTGMTQELLDGLNAKRFDLLFCSQPPDGMELTAVSVKTQDMVVITPRDHPLADRTAIDLAETLPYPQVYFAKGSGLRDTADRLYAQIGAKPVIACETEEDQVVAGLVAQGFGIAVLPYMDLLQKLDVRILPIHSPDFRRELFMVHDPNVYMPPVVRLFWQFVLAETA